MPNGYEKKEGKLTMDIVFTRMWMAIAAGLLLLGCGPVTSTQTRIEMKHFDEKESRQEKDGLIVEDKQLKEFPDSFYVQLQACNDNGSLQIQGGEPVVEKVGLMSPGQMWYNLAISNNTEHVLRFNAAVVRLFDPAGNETEPMTKDDIFSALQARRPCSTTAQAQSKVNLMKLFDRSHAELLPGSTLTTWLAFRPPSVTVPGIWKLAFYEVPVAVDESGKVTKRTRFELRSVAKKFIDTYQADSPFSPVKLVKSEEVTE